MEGGARKRPIDEAHIDIGRRGGGGNASAVENRKTNSKGLGGISHQTLAPAYVYPFKQFKY